MMATDTGVEIEPPRAMHAKLRLALDLAKSFSRTDHKLLKLVSYVAYHASNAVSAPALLKWRARLPIHAFILLTTRCNMSCEDCCFLDVINKKDLGRLDYDLAQITTNYRQPIFRAVSRVVLFGGEPTLCKSYVKIIGFFRSRGVVVCMTSNALRIDTTALEAMRDADLNMLNLTIYEKTECGKKYNLDALERIFKAAHEGAFDVRRIGLCYHSTAIDGYVFAYEFARRIGARHLLFNRTYYTDWNPSQGGNGLAESRELADEYNALCERIEREGRLRLYRPVRARDPKACSYTTNAVVMGPTNALSPCCLLTPKPVLGTVDRPEPLMRFKDAFIEGDVPLPCRGCHMLGARHL
jgi:hypothetical protein